MSLNAALAVIAAYLIGSISFAIVFSKLFQLADPRSYGSGNPGATNVLRSGNKAAALLTLLFDALKGGVPVWLAAQLGFGSDVLGAVALAAFLGHLYPVWHRFQGGKGVATALGVLVGLSWQLALAALLTFGVVVKLSRYVSLASISAAFVATLASALLRGIDAVTLAVLAMALLLVWRHRANVARLRAGTESKLGASKAA
ncbi:glycerol-3-phosphate 1-O-acyltransferase PlsY [Derxia lacustris]|uniref:glycerol-3-phosphate 1-O-acyltransferase PlsY n=1 Tax=Derxia lacustris TaxID=764842 RepID=UPI000A171FB3|nr:glycerol-3-phosphate 1-O-acyltransferase PlsY [Derxia lacustris]